MCRRNLDETEEDSEADCPPLFGPPRRRPRRRAPTRTARGLLPYPACRDLNALAARLPAQGGFARRLLGGTAGHGRRDLAWLTSDPYRVWISEIMLQQTQVATALPYFRRFISAPRRVFAGAGPDRGRDGAWAGLGYYARARNLHALRACRGAAPRRPLSPNVGGAGGSARNRTLDGRRDRSLLLHERAPVLDGQRAARAGRHWAIEGDPRSAPVVSRLWSARRSNCRPRATWPATRRRSWTWSHRLHPDAAGLQPLSGQCQLPGAANGPHAALPATRARRERPVRPSHVLNRTRRAGRAAATAQGGRNLGRIDVPAGVPIESVPAAACTRARSGTPWQGRRWRATARADPSDAGDRTGGGRRAGSRARDADPRRWVALDRIDQAALPAPHRGAVARSAATPLRLTAQGERMATGANDSARAGPALAHAEQFDVEKSALHWAEMTPAAPRAPLAERRGDDESALAPTFISGDALIPTANHAAAPQGKSNRLSRDQGWESNFLPALPSGSLAGPFGASGVTENRRAEQRYHDDPTDTKTDLRIFDVPGLGVGNRCGTTGSRPTDTGMACRIPMGAPARSSIPALIADNRSTSPWGAAA